MKLAAHSAIGLRDPYRSPRDQLLLSRQAGVEPLLAALTEYSDSDLIDNKLIGYLRKGAARLPSQPVMSVFSRKAYDCLRIVCDLDRLPKAPTRPNVETYLRWGLIGGGFSLLVATFGGFRESMPYLWNFMVFGPMLWIFQGGPGMSFDSALGLYSDRLQDKASTEDLLLSAVEMAAHLGDKDKEDAFLAAAAHELYKHSGYQAEWALSSRKQLHTLARLTGSYHAAQYLWILRQRGFGEEETDLRRWPFDAEMVDQALQGDPLAKRQLELALWESDSFRKTFMAAMEGRDLSEDNQNFVAFAERMEFQSRLFPGSSSF